MLCAKLSIITLVASNNRNLTNSSGEKITEAADYEQFMVLLLPAFQYGELHVQLQ